jgi:hypothetical protein
MWPEPEAVLSHPSSTKMGNILSYLLISLEIFFALVLSTKRKQTPWPLVSKRTIPTEPPTLVDEI